MELVRDGKLTNTGFLLLMKHESTFSGIELGHFQHGFRVTAFAVNKKEEGNTPVISGKVGEKLSGNQQSIILDTISEAPYITSAELSVGIGVSKRITGTNISAFKRKGLLERIGPDKGGYWKIKQRIE
jgi:ATP-dependent DNA helicase RecG